MGVEQSYLTKALSERQNRRSALKKIGGVAAGAYRNPLTVGRLEGGLTVVTAAAAAGLIEVATHPDINLPWQGRRTYNQERSDTGPYSENDMLPEANLIPKGNSLEINPEAAFTWLDQEQAYLDATRADIAKRPIAYTFSLLTPGQETDLSGNTLIPSFSLSVEDRSISITNGREERDEDGALIKGWLEVLPSDMPSLLVTTKTYPDGTNVHEPPNTINFPLYISPNNPDAQALLLSSHPLDSNRIEMVLPKLEAAQALTGERFIGKLYATEDPTDPAIVPGVIRGIAKDEAVIPDAVLDQTSILGKDDQELMANVVSDFEVYRAFYRQISTTNTRFNGTPIGARSAFEIGVKNYVKEVRSGLTEQFKNQRVTEQEIEDMIGLDDVFMFLNIDQYLPDDLKGTYDFGDRVHDPEVLFASTLAIRNNWGDTFYDTTDPERYDVTYAEKKPRLLIRQINNSIDTLLTAINSDKSLQADFVKPLQSKRQAYLNSSTDSDQ